METKEHTQAGNQIRIQTLGNRYLTGSKSLDPDPKNTLQVTMMRKVKGIPVPFGLTLSAGEIVGLAGDYYTKAGWGLQLQIPQGTDNRDVITAPVLHKEFLAFRAAYEDLASPEVTREAIQRIYNIENGQLPSDLKQAEYAAFVPEYADKLVNNEAHFSPWSLRAYIVGHRSALRMAKLAFICYQLAENETSDTKKTIKIPAEINRNYKKISKDKKSYGFSGKSDQEIYKELGDRYHAMAVARDLFAMHFYSDHFAAGHLSRLGLMRQTLPQQFGTLGSILVNNMHNEDNTTGRVTGCNPFTPDKSQDESFAMLREDNQVYGDGTYFKRSNDENSNMLINGMDNSLGDIARCLTNQGEERLPANYGGLTFLPEIDLDKPQPQPLFIAHGDAIYYRKDVWTIKMLSPNDYKETMANPNTQADYAKLNTVQAFLLVVKLRLGALFFSVAVEELKDLPSTNPENPEAVPEPVRAEKKASWKTVPAIDIKNLLLHGFFNQSKSASDNNPAEKNVEHSPLSLNPN